MRANISGTVSSNKLASDAQDKINGWFKDLSTFIEDKKKSNVFFLPNVTKNTLIKYVFLTIISAFGFLFFSYIIYAGDKFSDPVTFNYLLIAIYLCEKFTCLGRISFILLLIRSIYMIFISSYSLKYDRIGTGINNEYKGVTERLKNSVPEYGKMLDSYSGAPGSAETNDYILSIRNSVNRLWDSAYRKKRNLAIVLAIAGVLFITVFQYFIICRDFKLDSALLRIYFNDAESTKAYNIVLFWLSIPFTAFVLSVTEGYAMSVVSQQNNMQKRIVRILFLIPAIIYSFIVRYFIQHIGLNDIYRIPLKYIYWIVPAAVFVSLLLIVLFSDFEREKNVYSLGTAEIIKIHNYSPDKVKVTKVMVWQNVLLRSFFLVLILFFYGIVVYDVISVPGLVIATIIFSVIASLLLPAFRGKDSSTLECMFGRWKCISITIMFFVIGYTEILLVQGMMENNNLKCAETFMIFFTVVNIIIDLIRLYNYSPAKETQ